MITLEEFLYLENVVETQARSLIDKYKSLKKETPEQFRQFFASQTPPVILKKENVDTKTEKTLLLERFKSFRNSVDYITAKKYVEDQIKLNKRLKEIKEKGGTVEVINNLLSGITSDSVDPFFNFVIRKVLTGSDNGVLPSEELRTILDKLLLDSTIEYYDEQSDVERDTKDRIKSYQNLYKNKGKIRVPVLDERFLLNDFRYIVDTSFTSLPNAVSSEENIKVKMTDFVASGGNLAGGLTGGLTGGLSGTQGILSDDELKNKFLSDINNLVNTDSNSNAGLNAKVKELDDIVLSQSKRIQEYIDYDQQREDKMIAMAEELAKRENTIQSLQDSNQNLQNQIDTKISNLETNVEKQVKEIPDKFDELNKKLQQQADAAKSQSDALIKALTPATPPDNPAAPIIKEILPLIDKIYAVGFDSANVDNTTVFANYTKFKELLDKLSIPEPPKTDYLHLFNNFTPAGQELKQIIYFNDQLKPKLKAEVQKLTDKDKATSIKTLMQELVNINSSGPLTLLDVVGNAIKDWSENKGQSGGDGVPVIFDLYFELSPTYKRDNNPITKQMIDGNGKDHGKAYTELMTKQPLIPSIKTNPDRLLTVVRILNRISDVLTQPKNVTSEWTG